MEHYRALSTELQSLGSVPRDFATASAAEFELRSNLVKDEQHLSETKKALENAALDVEAASKLSHKVGGLLTGHSSEYKREAELADRALVSAQENRTTAEKALDARKVLLAQQSAKLGLLEGQIARYTDITNKVDAIYAETLGPFEFPANDILTSALRKAQGELESSELEVLTERETISHLHKALEAITKSIDEISRGNALLGKNDSANHHVADAYHSAQNFAHEFRAALREARAINGAVVFEEEVIVPRPPVRDGLASGRFAVSASTDGLVWEQAQRSYKSDLLIRDFFRSHEVATGELRLHAADSQARQARSAILIVEQTVRERRRRGYEERSA